MVRRFSAILAIGCAILQSHQAQSNTDTVCNKAESIKETNTAKWCTGKKNGEKVFDTGEISYNCECANYEECKNSGSCATGQAVKFTEWPRTFQENATSIDLNGHGITSLPVSKVRPQEGVAWPNLVEIRVSNNALTSVGDAVFEYCSNLEDLKLFNNLITELHAKAFAGLVKLQKLDLKQNLLESIDKAVFEPIHETLTELRLNSNKITSIAAHTFGCQSNTCSGKWTFTKLDLLDLSGNELQYLPETFYTDLFIVPVTHPTKIDLSNNGIYRMHKKAFDPAADGLVFKMGGTNKLVCGVTNKQWDCRCSYAPDWRLHGPTINEPGVAMQANDVLTDSTFDGAVVTKLDEYYCTNIQKCGQTKTKSDYLKTYRVDELKKESKCQACPLHSRTADAECLARRVTKSGAHCTAKPGESPEACHAPSALCSDTPVWRTACLCDIGHYGIQKDAKHSACTACDVHTYSDKIGASQCTACPAHSATGKYVTSNYIREWVHGTAAGDVDACLCVEGYFRKDAVPAKAMPTCESCAVDEYKDDIANRNCTACQGHSTTMNLLHRTSVDDCVCDSGYYRNVVAGYTNVDGEKIPELVQCVPCAKDHYRNQRRFGNNAEIMTCTACPAGSSTEGQTGSTDCVCNPGYRSTANDTTTGQPVCTLCAESTFKIGHGVGACDDCPRNSSSTASRRTCDCDEGWSGDIVNASSRCTECPINTFKNQKGGMECTACTANSNTRNVTASINLASCICDEGYTGQPASVGGGCVACPFSWYKTDVGPSECTRCPSGTETSILRNETGKKERQMAATRLTDCVCSEGYYPDKYTENRISCRPCDVDHYSDTISALAVEGRAAIGKAECSLCPLLSNTASKVASSTVDYCRCDPGHEPSSFEDYDESDGGGHLFQGSGASEEGSGSADDGAHASLRPKCSLCKPNFFKRSAGNAQCLPCAHLHHAPKRFDRTGTECEPYTASMVQDAFKKAERDFKECNEGCERETLLRETRTVEAVLLYWDGSGECNGEPSNIVSLDLADSTLSAFYSYEPCGVPSSEWQTCPPYSAVPANNTYAAECTNAVAEFVVSLEDLARADGAISIVDNPLRIDDESNFTVRSFTPAARQQQFQRVCFAAELDQAKRVGFRIECGVSADLAKFRPLKDIDCMGPSKCGRKLHELNQMKNSGLTSSTTTTATDTSTTTITSTTNTTTTPGNVTEESSLTTEAPKVPLAAWHIALLVITVVAIFAGVIFGACKVGYLHMPKWPEKEVPKEIGYGGHFGMLGNTGKEVRDHGQTVAAQWDADGDVYKMAQKEEEELRTVYPGGADNPDGNYGLGNTALPADEVYGMAQATKAKRVSSEDPNATYGLGAANTADLIEATYGLAGVDGNDAFQAMQDEMHHRHTFAVPESSDSEPEPEPEPASNVPAPSPYNRPQTTEEGIYGLGKAVRRQESEDTYGLAKATDEGTYGLGYAPKAVRGSDSEGEEGAPASAGGDEEGTYGLARVAARVGDGDGNYGLNSGQRIRRESEL